MKPVQVWRGLVMGLVVLGLGCTTKTTTEYKIPDCSSSYPNGACEAGKTCFKGACVETGSLCSPTNLAGTCEDGQLCFSGGCVTASSLCSVGNPSGPCETGKVCLDGNCTATASLCSTSNPTGACAIGKVCKEGVCTEPTQDPCTTQAYTQQPTIVAHTSVTNVQVITVDGKQFKDLNRNGTLDPYEDWRLPDVCRAKDLVSKMSAEQKLGLLGSGTQLGSGSADGVLSDNVKTNITTNHVRQTLLRSSSSYTTEQLGTYINNVEELCEAQPLGIPAIFSEDPTHALSLNQAASGALSYGGNDRWTFYPGTLGLGAINDVGVTQEFGETVAQEYRAVGFKWQLGPMADISTEPRWNRVPGTLGENAIHVARHVRAMVIGYQGSDNGNLRNGIAATMKHFPGHGAEEGGRDAHSDLGRYNVYPGNNFPYHWLPFQAAFDVGAAAIMPCYSVFKEQYEWDPLQVPSGFSYEMITVLARQKLGFTGMATGDWGTAGGRAFNLQMLTYPERGALWLHAGSDQFGSDSTSAFIDAYAQHLIGDEELNTAATRVLEMSFKVGLFENPYVDVANIANVVKSAEHRTKGFEAQKKAIVLLKNQTDPPGDRNGKPLLPITGTRARCDANGDGTVKVYFAGVNKGLTGSDPLTNLFGDYDYTSPANTTATPAVRAVESATTLADADIAVIRIVSRGGSQAAGIPLSFDKELSISELAGTTDGTVAATKAARNLIIDAFRVRDGYTKADGTAVAAANPKLKIVVVMHMRRPGIVKPFVNGLTTLDELPGQPGSYPLVSDEANVNQTMVNTTVAGAHAGIDAFLVDFGAYDRAVLDFLFNKDVPAGFAYGSAKLPIEIPSTDAAVEKQYEDLPSDSFNPTYFMGNGSALPTTLPAD